MKGLSKIILTKLLSFSIPGSSLSVCYFKRISLLFSSPYSLNTDITSSSTYERRPIMLPFRTFREVSSNQHEILRYRIYYTVDK